MCGKIVQIGLLASDWLEYFLTKYEFSAEHMAVFNNLLQIFKKMQQFKLVLYKIYPTRNLYGLI